MKKEKKKELVKELAEVLRQQSVAFFNFEGVQSFQMTEMRNQAREQGLSLRVIKRTLLIKALELAGLEQEIPQGHYLLGFSEEDEVLPFKFFQQFIKENEVGAFQGGVFEGKLVSAEEAENLAKLPSKEELQAQVVYLLRSPLQQLHYNLSYNLLGLLNILRQKAESA